MCASIAIGGIVLSRSLTIGSGSRPDAADRVAAGVRAAGVADAVDGSDSMRGPPRKLCSLCQ